MRIDKPDFASSLCFRLLLPALASSLCFRLLLPAFVLALAFQRVESASTALYLVLLFAFFHDFSPRCPTLYAFARVFVNLFFTFFIFFHITFL